jgi:ecotin
MMGGLLLINSSSFADDEDVDTSIYPSPKRGYVKMVIHLKENHHEDFLKTEIIIGKYLKVDSCNSYTYVGKLERKELDWWGYSYYELRNVEGPYSTQVGCPPGERVKFVTVHLEPDHINFIDYNSRLPIVVYVPEGFKVHYRIWKGYKKTGTAQVES